MALTKSKPNNILRPDGNTLYLYLDDPSGNLYLIDVLGNVEPLSNYSGTLENIGTGAEVYKQGTLTPSQLRTIKQGLNVLVQQNADEIEISVPSISGITMYRGAFYSNNTQTSNGNEIKKVAFSATSIGGQGVELQAGTEILIQQAGDYNIQHSIQLVRTQGGGQSEFYLWLIKNGVAVPDTNTKITFGNNNTFQVAAWNFFVTAAANDVFELGWYATSNHIELHADPAPVVGLPAIPSVILTVNRVG